MDDPRVHWAQATPFGIVIDENKDQWWAGRVFDVLEIDGGDAGLLLATETGGVWSISANNQATALSNSWDTPDTNCLAAGPDGPRHYFAGCDGPFIFETNANDPLPLLAWEPVDAPLPPDAGSVFDIEVIKTHRLIVAACAGGVFWAEIPVPIPWWCILTKPSSQGGKRPPYVWHKADAQGVGQTGYRNVAVGTTRGTEYYVSRKLSEVTVIVGVDNGGALVGQWNSGKLALKRPKLSVPDLGAGDFSDLYFQFASGPTSVATCELLPRHAYAVCARSDGLIAMIIRSTDGGMNWQVTGFDVQHGATKADIRTLAGDQGAGEAPNNCIAVHPTAPGVVAIGWQNGTFVTPLEGTIWMQIGPEVHHADIHCVLFKHTTPDDKHLLYVGGDGGIAQVSTDDLFQHKPLTARSDYNRNLANLQMYATWVTRQFYGTMSAATNGSGRVIAGVHDNGDVSCDLSAGPGPWRQVYGCDGGWTGIVADGGAICGNLCGTSQPLRGARPTPSGFVDVGVVEVKAPPDPKGLLSWAGDVVRKPTHHNQSHELMVAAGGGANGDVYGAFAAAPGKYHFEKLGTLTPPLPYSAAASFSGSTVMLGSADGRSAAIDSANGTVTQLQVQLPTPAAGSPQTGGSMVRIVMLSERIGFAILNATSAGNNYVLRLDTLRWIVPASIGLPTNLPFYGIEAVMRGGQPLLFVSTDDRVYMSEDGGDNWVRASLGLPRRPHCAELRMGKVGAQTRLYLGTFGRSLWQADLSHLLG